MLRGENVEEKTSSHTDVLSNNAARKNHVREGKSKPDDQIQDTFPFKLCKDAARRSNRMFWSVEVDAKILSRPLGAFLPHRFSQGAPMNFPVKAFIQFHSWKGYHLAQLTLN